jgi:hypothetical protein
MTPRAKAFIVRLVFVVLPVHLTWASGGYWPSRWLDNGGVAGEQSPEFTWEIEVRKLAPPFKPVEVRVPPRVIPPGNGVGETLETEAQQARRCDQADFEAALKEGRIKPADPQLALRWHMAARDAVAEGNKRKTHDLPQEERSEFADYHRGALAFNRGKDQYQQARAEWQALLDRPPAERHYRSVWAAFMLGKLALESDSPEAVTWFRLTRELAKEGFADSLGLAADSYGWEARSELRQDHLEAAARLYLTQLALGDGSALVSLKMLVPDRQSSLEAGENADQAALRKLEEERSARQWEGLRRAARDPVLRNIVSIHVLVTGSGSGSSGVRCRRWLEAIEEARVEEAAGAEWLAWVAYAGGYYPEAERWVGLAAGDSAAALWLKSKLLRREGKLDAATEAMAAAFDIIRSDPLWECPYGPDYNHFVWPSGGWSPRESAAGELGAMRLSRAEFVQALESFLNAGLWVDAAFIADHVLTTKELKQYVDAKVPPNPDDEARAGAIPADTETRNGDLRWLLGRRLVRESQHSQARPYLPPPYQEVLDRYAAALAAGANPKLPKRERAKAWFQAAVIARYDGMEIMGTEVEPDWFVCGGDYEPSDVASERAAGVKSQWEFRDGKYINLHKPLKLSVPASKEERKRLLKNRPMPNKRFHYRYIAAGLGWKAAQLLPDQTDELADVLNTCGRWLQREPMAADKFFQAIERRAWKTEIGKAAGARHWFVAQTGPWSGEAQQQ